MGNSSTVIYYSAVDHNPYNGISYKRLKQTDFDGKSAYSDLVTVNFKKIVDFTIYPNPFTTSINILINDVTQITKYELRLFNVLGTEVMNVILIKLVGQVNYVK